MHAYARKLPPHVADHLRKCTIASVSPYALMPTPTYVFMPKNKKFVSIKSPLDFFAPEELERLKPFGEFYVPAFIDQVSPFRSAGISAKSILTWKDDKNDLGLVPYEASNSLLRVIAPLWGSAMRVDSLCLTVFCNELFDSLPEEIIRKDQQSDIEQFETALFRSSLSVFLALHLGYPDIEGLRDLRDSWFSIGREPKDRLLSGVKQISKELVESSTKRFVEPDQFKPVEGPLKCKLFNRMMRIKQEVLNGSLRSIDYDRLLEGLWQESA